MDSGTGGGFIFALPPRHNLPLPKLPLQIISENRCHSAINKRALFKPLL